MQLLESQNDCLSGAYPLVLNESANSAARSTWFRLIADMQGDEGVSLIRARFRCSGDKSRTHKGRSIKIAFEVCNLQGALFGSAFWEGEYAQLISGTHIDIGYSLDPFDTKTTERHLVLRARVIGHGDENTSSWMPMKQVPTEELFIA